MIDSSGNGLTTGVDPAVDSDWVSYKVKFSTSVSPKMTVKYVSPEGEDKAKDEKQEKEKSFTPGFDFSEEIEHDGKTRKIEMTDGGLYVFNKKEKFNTPPPPVPPVEKSGVWIGFQHPTKSGNVLVAPASKPGDFRTVKVTDPHLRNMLTKKA